MKEKNKQEYIRIQAANFAEHSSWRAGESLFRSLEHYLVKNKRSYNLDGESRIIYVDNKNDAMRIGNDIGLRFGLSEVEYFNGEELSILTVVSSEKKRRVSRATVTDIASGKKVSFTKFKKETKKEIDQKYISFRDIARMKIMSKVKLEKLVSAGSLKKVTIGSKEYVNRVELLYFLNKK